MAAMKKLERLLDLVALLLEAERPLGRHEIRDGLPPGAYADDDEAFRRTFERDKDELRNLGIPIEVESFPGWDASQAGRLWRQPSRRWTPMSSPASPSHRPWSGSRMRRPTSPSGCWVEAAGMPTSTGQPRWPMYPVIRSSAT